MPSVNAFNQTYAAPWVSLTDNDLYLGYNSTHTNGLKPVSTLLNWTRRVWQLLKYDRLPYLSDFGVKMLNLPTNTWVQEANFTNLTPKAER